MPAPDTDEIVGFLVENCSTSEEGKIAPYSLVLTMKEAVAHAERQARVNYDVNLANVVYDVFPLYKGKALPRDVAR